MGVHDWQKSLIISRPSEVTQATPSLLIGSTTKRPIRNCSAKKFLKSSSNLFDSHESVADHASRMLLRERM